MIREGISEKLGTEGGYLMKQVHVWRGALQAEGMAGGKAVRWKRCLVHSGSRQIHVAKAELICILCSHKEYSLIVNCLSVITRDLMCGIILDSENIWPEGKSGKPGQCHSCLGSWASRINKTCCVSIKSFHVKLLSKTLQ